MYHGPIYHDPSINRNMLHGGIGDDCVIRRRFISNTMKGGGGKNL